MARSGSCSPTRARSDVGVPGAPDDVVAGVLQQAGEPLAEQHGVLGDDYTHGNSAAIRVPAPGGLSMTRRPALGGDAVGEPREARAAVRRGAADPVVGDEQVQDAVALVGPQLDLRGARRA